MPNRSRKRKNDAAGGIVGAATQDIEVTAEQIKETAAHNAAVALGRLGGLKGGKSRAAKLSKKKRTAIARKAAAARGGPKRGIAPS